MSANNRFRHQRYDRAPPTSPYRLLRPAPRPPSPTAEYRARFRAVGDRLRDANVAGLYLVHGTFVGADALGTIAEIARLLPKAGTLLRALAKQWIDSTLGDVGNYTEKHVRLLTEGLGSADGQLPVRLFNWTSQNDHIGRADGAVRLIHELSRLKIEPDRRLLLWGHSHAGNVFALVSNLLAADRETRARFFHTARAYYRWPLFGCVDVPVWERVRRLLDRRQVSDWCPKLDLVTFGTPIRYGWDSDGYAQLLHFINHRPAEGIPKFLAPFPPTLDHLLDAYDGDYVQQFGIAGTNLAPNLLAWRTWWSDRRLGWLLEEGISPANVADRFKIGARVPHDGTTLLVDYGPPGVEVHQHHAGHAVYTRPDWLLFHAEEVARELYGESQ